MKRRFYDPKTYICQLFPPAQSQKVSPNNKLSGLLQAIHLVYLLFNQCKKIRAYITDIIVSTDSYEVQGYSKADGV